MFYTSKLEPKRGLIPICHLVDARVRWFAAGICASKEEVVVLTCIGRVWIARFGAMETLVTDVDGLATGKWCYYKV